MAEAAAAHSQLENLDIFRLQREDYFGFLEVDICTPPCPSVCVHGWELSQRITHGTGTQAHIEQGRRLERLGQSVAARPLLVSAASNTQTDRAEING